jgi:ribose transport system ATP-binding protein
MSDRIMVFHEGRVAGELARGEFSEEAIMHLATATNGNETQVAEEVES